MVAHTTGMKTKNVIPIFQEWIRMYGKPTHVRTDGGPCFKHKDFATWCKDKNIVHETSSPHHHESNGQAERAIREVKNLLKKTDAHMETFQDALTEYKNTPGYDGLAPTQWAFGHLQRTDVPAPKSAYERITDEKLLEHIGRRGMVLRSVLMSSPRPSFKTFNPGDRCIFKTRKSMTEHTCARSRSQSFRRKSPPS